MTSNKNKKRENEQWCSDQLHTLLGYTDTGLAKYLTSVASSSSSSSSSFREVMNVLKEGEVVPVCGGGDDALERFSRRLSTRCMNGGHGTSANWNAGQGRGSNSTSTPSFTSSNGTSGPSGERRMETNADLWKRAKEYDTIDDSMDYEVLPPKTRTMSSAPSNFCSTPSVVSNTVVSSSSRSRSKSSSKRDKYLEGERLSNTSRDKRSSKSRRRRRRSDSTSSSSSQDSFQKEICRTSSSRDNGDTNTSNIKDKRKRRRRKELSSSEEESDDNQNNNSNTASKTRDVKARFEEQKEERRRQRMERLRGDNEDVEKEQKGKLDSSKVLGPEEREEIERLRDIRERDEFAKRLIQRDVNKQKGKRDDNDDDDDDDIHSQSDKNESHQITSEADKKKEKLRKMRDLERRLAMGETVVDETTGQTLTLDKIREESRRQYLKKRTDRELTLLEQQLEEEEEMFQGQNLTEMEKKRIELNKNILRMARKDSRKGEDDDDDEDDGFYKLPDDYDEDATRKQRTKAERDDSLLTSRYKEEKGEKTEQQLWEESQTKKAMTIHRNQQQQTNQDSKYELIFEDQIDFVMTDTNKGYDHRVKRNVREYKSTSRKDSYDSYDSMNNHPKDSPKTKDIQKQKQPRQLTSREKMAEGRKKLPVYPYRDEFLAAVKDHKVLVLVGETGSGKTTQIPQYLNEVGYGELGKIGCTQPRRVAAMSVAARVATEMGVRVGHEVGYSIRFENCTSNKTIIQYMTDGMLLREFLAEPDLASYSCLVIDEAHERTLHTDILFGLVKDIVRFRDDLKLIISSATLDAEKFSKYFDDASIFMIPGRMFPVDIYYTKSPEADYVDASVVTVLQIHISQPLNGDVLVFLTGQEEIETAAEILTQRTKALGSRIHELIICPIYANLPSEQQAKIFEKTPKGARKVVLATNIAETSLTIDGICYVIDTGFNKQNSYNARSGMETLMVTPISQAASNQRAGRAGRTQPGKCFRLFTSWSFSHELEPNTTPEIMRTNMANVVLMLKSLGINDLVNFDFMDKPPADTLIRALEQLYALGALNNRGELTKLGRRMAEFPLDPQLSKAVIASEKYECVKEVLSTVSMLSIGASVFHRPKEKAVHADTARMNFARGGGGDHISLLRCYTEWAETNYSSQWCFETFVQVRSMRKARDIREQLEGLCERVEIDPELSKPDDLDAIIKSITAGFFYNTAKLSKSGDYQTVKQHRTVYIHPSSVLAKEEELPGWLVYFELAFTTKEFMRQVAPINPSWLVEIAPHFYQESDIEDAKVKKMPKNVHK